MMTFKEGPLRLNKNVPLDLTTCANESDLVGMGNPDVLYTINALNGLICLVGLGGNLLVFYVVCRFSVLHTVTNIFILMLALADIAFLVNIPFLMATAVLENWPFGNSYCKIYYSITTVNQFASSFFLVTMSADRYVAICLPIRSRQIRTNKTAVLVCSLVWALAIMLMYPVFLYADSVTDGSVTHCNIFWPDYVHVSGHHAFVLYCFVLGYAFPVAFMLTFYGLVVQKLRSRQQAHEPQGHPASALTAVPAAKSAQTKKRRGTVRRVTLMIFVVILVYLLCWTPYWASQLFIVFSASNQFNHIMPCSVSAEDIRAGQQIVYLSLILQCLCFANSAVNPILYAILSENFKQSYARACQRCTSNGNTQHSQSGRESSFRPENSHYRLSAAPSPNPFENGRIYLNCHLQTPLMLTPTSSSTNGIISCNGASTKSTSVDPEDEENEMMDCQIIKGEVRASFHITAWTPLLKGQELLVGKKAMMTSFEVSPEPNPSTI